MYVQESRRWVKHIDFITFDVICLIVSFILSYKFRDGFTFDEMGDRYKLLLAILVLIHASIIFLSENFGGVLKRGYYQEFLATLRQAVAMVAFATVMLFATKSGDDYSRIIIFSTFVVYLVMSYIMRITWKNHVRRKLDAEKNARNLIIITKSERLNEVDYQDLITKIDKRRIGGLIVIDEDMSGQDIQGIKVVSGKDDMVEYLIRNWVDEIYIDMNPMSDEFQPLFTELADTGITLHARLENYGNNISRISAIERLGKIRVLTTSIRVVSTSEQFIKRLCDIVGAIVGIMITAILSIFVIPAIKIADPGPAFYVSERIGTNGKKFKFYKFRSMYMDADERKKELASQNTIKDGMMFKLDDDPRIINGIGKFIRRTSIDEFPQFYNVLKGDMSIVGTRPPTPDEWEKYGKHHRTRMSIRPGITGMWQVSGRSDIKDFEEVVKLDNQYMNDWNFGLDVKIILQTIQKIVRSEGAK